MAGEEVLLTIAEVAIAFAGFSGLVAIFGSRAAGRWSRSDRYRLALMLETSLAAILFAFLPFSLRYLNVEGSVLWTVSSGGLATFLLVELILVIPRTRRLYRGSGETLSPTFGLIIASLALLALIVQVLNAAGIGLHRDFGPYLVGLLLLLVVSGIQFVRLLFMGIARAG